MKSKYSYLFSCISLLLICLQNPVLSSEEVLKTGSLIVTYQTGPQAEKLGRVRFWLKDANGRQYLYPQGKAYVDDLENQTRMVVIENLLPGKYTLEFLVPNTDNYFAEVPPRQVVIAKGDVAKIDQKIEPKTTYWGISRRSSEDLRILPPKPAKTEEVLVREEKREKEQPLGKLIVSFDASFQPSLAKNIRFKLVDNQGNFTTHPDSDEDTEIPLTMGSMVVIADVFPGEYSLEFFVAGEDSQSLSTTKPFLVDEGKTKSIHHSLTPSSSQKGSEEASTVRTGVDLNVTANIPTAVFYLENEDGIESPKGKGRLHTFENLKPGMYRLFFESYDPFFDPPQEMYVEIGENEENEVEAIFDSLGKLKILANEDSAKVTINDINRKQDSIQADLLEGMGVVYLPEGEYRLIFSKPESGKTPPQPVDITINSLQTKEINVYFAAPRMH